MQGEEEREGKNFLHINKCHHILRKRQARISSTFMANCPKSLKITDLGVNLRLVISNVCYIYINTSDENLAALRG